MSKSTIAACLFLVVLLVITSQASAQATRTWVSGVGDDANPCSRTSPCKTFAGAISRTAPGGEIDVLDPGGFGSITITKAITIDGGANTGGVLHTLTSSGIIINAAANDTVTLRNITIQGLGTGGNGIRVLSAAVVNIERCTIVNQAVKGIDAQPTSACKLFISDTVVRGDQNAQNGGGIFLKPAAGGSIQAFLNRVQTYKNAFGLRAEDNTITTARDCDFSGNDTHGIVAVAATAVVNLDRCTMAKNAQSGLRSTNGSTIRFGNCLIVNNATGLDNVGGNLISFTNNMNAGNATPGAPSGASPLQ